MLLCCAVPSQLRNSSVFTHFHFDSSAARSSATKKYGTVPELPGSNEEQDSINVSKRCAVKPDIHFNMKSWIASIILFNVVNLLVFSYYSKTFDFLFILVFIVTAREQAPWCPFLTDYARTFSVEKWKRRSLWGRKWMERCLFPARVGIFCLYS